MRILRKLHPEPANKPPFTGTCPVREHTQDGRFVGRCYFATYGGICLRHGNVSRFLGEGADLTDADDRKLI